MSDEKTHTIHIHVNQEQYSKLRGAALAYSIPVSTYAKQAALRQYNVDIKEYARKLNAAKAEIVNIEYPGMEQK